MFCVRCECILPEIAVEIALQQKETRTLMPTIILHQTSLWSSVKFRLGWAPYAFDFTSQKIYGDMLVLVRRIHENACIAYVPQGPEMVPDEDSKGIFLESLSQNLMEHLPDDCTFIRYDLPWETPYASDPARYDAGGDGWDVPTRLSGAPHEYRHPELEHAQGAYRHPAARYRHY